jgi:hypothetical protein
MTQDSLDFVYEDDNIPDCLRRPIGLAVASLLQDPKLILYAKANSRDKLVLVYRLFVEKAFRDLAFQDEMLDHKNIKSWIVKRLESCEKRATEWLADTMYEKYSR